MKKILSLLTAVSFLFVVSAATFAQSETKTPGINQRQRNQRQRVRQGVRSGELTRGEAERIRDNQQEIRHDEHAAKADGVVTHQERREIKQDQRKASRQIYRTKHNRRDRN